MQRFIQWMAQQENTDENNLRTSLGIYPPEYGAGQYPSLYFAPISASAGFSLKYIHPNLLKKDKKGKKTKKKHK